MEEMTKDFLKEANKKGAVSKEDLKLLEDFMDSKPLKWLKQLILKLKNNLIGWLEKWKD